MKLATSLAIASAVSATIASAAPMISVGDNVDIFFKLDTAVTVDDNVTYSPTNALDDVIFTVTPGLEFDLFRGETIWDASLTVQNEFLRYTDNDQFDVDNLLVYFNANYGSPVISANFDALFTEEQQKTQQRAGSLIEVENLQFGGDVTYQVSKKVKARVNSTFLAQDYVGTFGAVLADRDVFNFGVKGFYAMSPLWDLTVGANYRKADIDDTPTQVGVDPEDVRLTVGVDGTILPKLKGEFDIGYTERSFDSGSRGDETLLYVAGALSWEATPKLNVKLNISQDFASTVAGNPIESSTASVEGIYSINDLWTVAPFISFLSDDYISTDREDDMVTGGVGVYYSPNGYLNFGLTAYYLENDSTINLDYDNTVVELTASLRY
ncbi:MAG: outer membrane beta-barrel protein [Opitutales bacterium]